MARTEGILGTFNTLRTEEAQRQFLLSVLTTAEPDRLGYSTLPLQDLLAIVLSQLGSLHIVTQRKTNLQ